jgi:mono/diheme cytochrome c family protein
MIEKYVDAQELKRLLSSLTAILLGLIIMALFASIVVPGLRNANKPGTSAGAGTTGNETGWLDLTEFPPERGRTIPPVDPQTLIASSPELVDRGKELFEQNCVQCHGHLGNGDGPAATTMNPPPRNFTDSSGWVNGYDLPGIYKTLSKGINGTSMRPFDYLRKRNRMALAHYVQTLGEFSHGSEDAQAMENLSKELASGGEKIPNKIPVSMAMTKLEEEFVPPPPLVEDEKDQSPGAAILRRVVIDSSRAPQVLMQSQVWRKSDQGLAASILQDTPGNGFSISTATLSPSEWGILYAELLKRLK